MRHLRCDQIIDIAASPDSPFPVPLLLLHSTLRPRNWEICSSAPQRDCLTTLTRKIQAGMEVALPQK